MLLQEVRACLDIVNERRREAQQEQLDRYAVLAGESGPDGQPSTPDDLEALEGEAEDIMVKAKKPAASTAAKRKNKKKGKSGKGRR